MTRATREAKIRDLLKNIRARREVYPLLVIGTNGDPTRVFDMLTEELHGSGVRILTDPTWHEVSEEERQRLSMEVVRDTSINRIVVTDDMERFARKMPAAGLALSFRVMMM